MKIGKRGNIELDFDSTKNVIYHKPNTYLLKNFQGLQGANSSVFNLTDPNGEFEDRIIKFCKYGLKKKRRTNKRIERFRREIDALKKAREEEADHIVEFFFDGEETIDRQTHLYYVMEKADSNLRTYLEENELGLHEKIRLCYDITLGLKELHGIGVYHRDIKPENILFTGNKWKVADLGLIGYRDKDFDDCGEMIGPTGWLSPEAMNKVYTEQSNFEYSYHCQIDEVSDMFQLGKLFWYIFQGNVPIGQIRKSDFNLQNNELFEFLFKLLQYSRERRLKMDKLQKRFEKLVKKYQY